MGKLKVTPTKGKGIKYTGVAFRGFAPGKKLKVKPSTGTQKTANPMKVNDGFRGSSAVRTVPTPSVKWKINK